MPKSYSKWLSLIIYVAFCFVNTVICGHLRSSAVKNSVAFPTQLRRQDEMNLNWEILRLFNMV